jgi:hypothetical protein
MIILAVILALLEIQIEGKNGCAGNLPCWRMKKKWIVKIVGGRPLTGYHFFMFIFLTLMVHMPLFFTTWSWRLECLLLGFLIGLRLIEDFLWFVLNPHYRLKNFKRGKIWWHPKWWGGVPVSYWYNILIVGLLFYFGWPAL